MIKYLPSEHFRLRGDSEVFAFRGDSGVFEMWVSKMMQSVSKKV